MSCSSYHSIPDFHMSFWNALRREERAVSTSRSSSLRRRGAIVAGKLKVTCEIASGCNLLCTLITHSGLLYLTDDIDPPVF